MYTPSYKRIDYKKVELQMGLKVKKKIKNTRAQCPMQNHFSFQFV